jgi:MYND finger
MPPSSLKKKEKKSSQKQRAIQKRIDEENEKNLADAFMATSIGRAVGSTRSEAEAETRASLANPDNPPCDGCLSPFAGTMQCAGCESVFYCCRECQVSHWTSKHKAVCAELKSQNEVEAGKVLGRFEDASTWILLDMTRTYNAAVRQGLHDKIRRVMELDKINCSAGRYRNAHSYTYTFYTEHVMNDLFRGQRAEGKGDAFPFVFDCMDGLRIKDYVRSHPDALDAWWQASVQLLHALTDRTLLSNPDAHRALHKTAGEVWDSWCIVFTSKDAARAILTPFPLLEARASNGSNGGGLGQGAEQRGKLIEAHARQIVTILKDAIRLIDSDAGSRADPETSVKTCVCEATAMVQLRIQEYGIDIDVESILDWKGTDKRIYQYVAIPMAKRGIEKGRKLTTQESNAVMAAAVCGPGLIDADAFGDADADAFGDADADTSGDVPPRVANCAALTVIAALVLAFFASHLLGNAPRIG